LLLNQHNGDEAPQKTKLVSLATVDIGEI